MRYVSIDIETTGTDPENDQILEFAAIIEDTKNPLPYDKLPKFRRIVLQPDRRYSGSAFALALNANLIKLISDYESGKPDKSLIVRQVSNDFDFCEINDLMRSFKTFLFNHGFGENIHGIAEIVAAGKNFGSFDKQFIQRIPEFETYALRFHYRSLDPTLTFINWDDDVVPPSTENSKKRAKLSGGVSHQALDDAWDVIQLLRVNYVHHFETVGIVNKEDLISS